MICHQCHQAIVPPALTSGGTGFAEDDQGNKTCYQCCANQDRAYMREHGRIMLYLTHDKGIGAVTNWPGTLRFAIGRVKKSHHNIARHRYDVWFTFDHHIWHGVQYGDNTQICHCKKTKERTDKRLI
jgi:hypothetical protein